MSKRFYKFVINILAPELSINIFKSKLVLNENINSRVMASFFRYFNVIRQMYCITCNLSIVSWSQNIFRTENYLLLDTRNIIL